MNYKKCANCEERTPPDERISHNGAEYCDDCFSELFVSCETCDETVDYQDAIYHNETFYCRYCTDRYFIKCEDCEEYTLREESYITRQHDSYCEDCVYENASNCDICEELNHDSCIEFGRERICTNCHEEENSNIHAYSYKPDPIFFMGKNETEYKPYSKNERRLVFGFELEVENKGSSTNNNCAEQLKKLLPDLLYMKQDGSIEHGFEIVSHPMSYEFYKENKFQLEKMLIMARNLGLRSYDTTTCGLHISLSRKAFTESTYLKFVNFFNKKSNHQLLRVISQRLNNKLEEWCSLNRFASRNHQIKLSKMKNTGANTKRYQALNLQNENVLEIRLFRGTLNASSFFKAFECVFAIYDFCLQMSFADLQINKRKKLNKESKQIAKHNDGSRVANISNQLIEKRFFHTFIYKNRKQYKDLNRFLTLKYGTHYNCGKDDSKVKELNQILNQKEGGYYSCV